MSPWTPAHTCAARNETQPLARESVAGGGSKVPASTRECLCSELLPGCCGHISRWAERDASRGYSRRSTMRTGAGAGLWPRLGERCRWRAPQGGGARLVPPGSERLHLIPVLGLPLSSPHPPPPPQATASARTPQTWVASLLRCPALPLPRGSFAPGAEGSRARGGGGLGPGRCGVPGTGRRRVEGSAPLPSTCALLSRPRTTVPFSQHQGPGARPASNPR